MLTLYQKVAVNNFLWIWGVCVSCWANHRPCCTPTDRPTASGQKAQCQQSYELYIWL